MTVFAVNSFGAFNKKVEETNSRDDDTIVDAYLSPCARWKW